MSANSTAARVNSSQSDNQPDATVHFVGRQPIFDRDKEIFGYELLFRSGTQNTYGHTDGNLATAHVINDSLNVLGLAGLVGGAKAFVNFDREGLLRGDYQLLPSNVTVVELLEHVEPDDEVLGACRAVKQKGYALALDDFVGQPGYEPLLELADIVKIDFMECSLEKCKDFGREFASRRFCLLAEKVETHEDFRAALNSGYAYAQGYFFCKPEIVTGKDIPNCKRKYLMFLREVSRPDLDFDRLERITKEEVSLSLKLLRYLNSAGMGLGSKVESIKQALVLMGQKPLQKWAALAATTCMGEGKPTELMRATLVRARFCEAISRDIAMADREFDMFLMGLVSTIDAIVDRPMDELLSEIPVPFDVRAALLGSTTRLGNALALTIACERGDMDRFTALGRELELSEGRIAQTFSQAIQWAQEIMQQ